MIFNEQIRIFGNHARILKKYSRDKGGDNSVENIVEDGKSVYLFDTMIQGFMVAAMWGIVEKRKEEPCKTGDEMYATIFSDIINKNRKNIERIYQHMILATRDDLADDEKIKKAFTTDRSPEEDKEAEEEILAYVFGGLEIIDELFNGKETYESITNVIYSLNNLLYVGREESEQQN